MEPTATNPDSTLAAANDPAEGGRPDPDWPDLPGFAVEAELGRGGMGVVYRARDEALGRVVAVKVMLAGGHATTATRERFLTEAAHMARLAHPHVVPVLHFGRSGGLPFLVMEHLPGGTIADRFKAGPIPPAELVGLLEPVARAVGHFHRHGLVHRDLKPENVLLDAAGVPRVADFGLAKEVGAAGQTRTEAILGTPRYMAPEVAGGGGRDATPAADVWAVGVMLYEGLAGHRPFDGKDAWAVLDAIRTAEPSPLPRAIPAALSAVCLKCLEKAPERRYQDAGAVAAELQRWRVGQPVTAQPPWTGQAFRRGRRLGRLWPVGVAAAVAFAAWRELRHDRLTLTSVRTLSTQPGERDKPIPQVPTPPPVARTREAVDADAERLVLAGNLDGLEKLDGPGATDWKDSWRPVLAPAQPATAGGLAALAKSFLDSPVRLTARFGETASSRRQKMLTDLFLKAAPSLGDADLTTVATALASADSDNRLVSAWLAEANRLPASARPPADFQPYLLAIQAESADKPAVLAAAVPVDPVDWFDARRAGKLACLLVSAVERKRLNGLPGEFDKPADAEAWLVAADRAARHSARPDAVGRGLAADIVLIGDQRPATSDAFAKLDEQARGHLDRAALGALPQDLRSRLLATLELPIERKNVTSLLDAGRPAEAASAAQRLVQRGSEAGRPAFQRAADLGLLARAHHEAGEADPTARPAQWPKAHEAYREALRLRGTDIEQFRWRYGLGRIEQWLGDREIGAAQLAEKADHYALAGHHLLEAYHLQERAGRRNPAVLAEYNRVSKELGGTLMTIYRFFEPRIDEENKLTTAKQAFRRLIITDMRINHMPFPAFVRREEWSNLWRLAVSYVADVKRLKQAGDDEFVEAAEETIKRIGLYGR